MKTITILLLFLTSLVKAQEVDIFPQKELPKPISTINCMAFEGDTVLWLGTNAGLVKVSSDTTIIYFDSTNKAKFKINKIVITEDGTKWLGTYRSSLVSFKNDLNAVEYSFKELTGNKFQLVTALYSANNSLLWIGTSEGKLIQFNTVDKKYSLKNSPVKSEVYSILPDQEQSNWIGTADGLYLNYKGDKWRKVSELSRSYGIFKNGDDYWTIGRDAKNQSVLLYNEQFYLSVFFMMNISKQQWQRMIFEGLPNNFIKMNDIDFDKNGFIWVATEDGIIRYNPETGKGAHYSSKDYPGLKFKDVANISVQSNQVIWLTSRGKELVKVVLK